MKIKVSATNKGRIESELKKANGKAYRNVISTYDEVEELCNSMEDRLDDIGLPKAERAGVEACSTAGDSVCNAYARKAFYRNATSVRVVRGSKSWYLTDAELDQIYQNGGKTELFLTKAQADKAVSVLLRSFTIVSRNNA